MLHAPLRQSEMRAKQFPPMQQHPPLSLRLPPSSALIHLWEEGTTTAAPSLQSESVRDMQIYVIIGHTFKLKFLAVKFGLSRPVK